MFLITFSKAQGDMRFLGAATKDGSPLSGATVVVVMDGKQIFNLKTGKNGKFKFKEILISDLFSSFDQVKDINLSFSSVLGFLKNYKKHSPSIKL